MTAHERLTRFEQWRESLPARQTTYEVIRELEAIAARIRAEQPSSKFTPFPDPVGDDRDSYVRLIEVEQWK